MMWRRSDGVLRSWGFTPEDWQTFCVRCAVWIEGIASFSFYPESLSGGWSMWRVLEPVRGYATAQKHSISICREIFSILLFCFTSH